MALNLALIQTCTGMDPAAEFAHLGDIIARAAEGADLVTLPEMAVAFAENAKQLKTLAEPWENNSQVAWFAEQAAKNQTAIALGSLAVMHEDGRFANRSVVFTASGEIAATYDKIHMFDVTLAGEKPYRESATYQPGTRAVAVSLPLGQERVTLGLTVCYDLRFSYLYRDLVHSGAQIFMIPAAFTRPTGKAHWHTLIRARAIETSCFVIATAQSGTHANGRSTYGHSLVVNPWGEVLVDGEQTRQTTILRATIDLADLGKTRNAVPSLTHDCAGSYEIKLLEIPS
ncbi:MAG: carbon-nitrogen hydrolase family protein [Pseudomonadota bacterium]